ncbi:Lipoprotein [Pararobbsia alpina]|uniref:hypothetical protein n=1 Tax=Pararobbsia alpina TaxID=621374 RepID=UPI0039A450A1
MKKMLLRAAGLALSAALAIGLAACSTTQQQTASQALAKLQTDIVNGCMVVQPTLIAVAAIDPTVQVAATANGLVCTAAASITPTSVQTLLSTGIPAIEQAVTQSTLIPANQKPLVTAALGVFQLTATNALAIYGQAAASTAAASGPAAASAPQ